MEEDILLACSCQKEWIKILVFGMTYIVRPEKLKSLDLRQMIGYEGEFERICQTICIYEIYNGFRTWPFLHHSTLYRGLSLSKGARRLTSNDVDSVDRFPVE